MGQEQTLRDVRVTCGLSPITDFGRRSKVGFYAAAPKANFSVQKNSFRKVTVDFSRFQETGDDQVSIKMN
jgi:hypothetical protein